MDFRHLRTFVTVAELGTVSKAAVQLHTAQPALSRQIADLEIELGLKLFDRIGRRLVLTLEGEQLLINCRGLLEKVGSIREQAELLRGGETGILKVAASPIQIESSLSTFLPIYARRYPLVQVKLIESVGGDTLDMLGRGDIHVCISVLDAARAARANLGAYSVPPLEVLAAGRAMFHIKHGSLIDISQLASFPLLLLDSSFVARKNFDAACSLAKFKPNIMIESRSPHTVLALAEAGFGIAVVSSAIRTHRYRLDIARVAYKRKPIRDPLSVVWDKRRVLPAYARDFCQLLAAHMREFNISGRLFPIRK